MGGRETNKGREVGGGKREGNRCGANMNLSTRNFIHTKTTRKCYSVGQAKVA